MGRYGIKAALPGNSAANAPDNRMAFSSAWPTLKIHKQGTFKLPANLFTRQNIYNHNLGYAPMFWVFFDSTNSRYPSGSSHPFNTFDAEIGVDETTIYAPSGGLTTEVTGSYVIFKNPLEQNYTAPINYRGVGQSDSVGTYGLQAGKETKAFNDKDITNIALTSNARTPLIQAVKSGKVSIGTTIEIEHNLYEIPEFFVYAKISGNNFWQIIQGSDDSVVTVTETKLNAIILYNCEYSAWVLKQSLVKR